MASSGGEDRLVIGFDFGTTYSGVSFTYSGNPEPADEIAVVKNWPGSNNISSEKVPSELAYVPASDDFEIVNPSDADTFEIRWGLQLKPDQPRLRCLKLKLDPRQKLPHYVSEQDLDDQLAHSGKTTEEAISDYMSLVYQHAQEALVRRFGQQMVSTTPIEVVLTVPAVWTDAAKDATFRVAKNAGMGPNLHMISEPEAAAIYSLKSMEQESKMLHVGDNFIVCDAGGGTVDLASYSICSLSPLRLEESAPGTGALCGGVFLNLRFQALVKSRMGSAAFKKLCERKPKSWAIALRYFEDYVKKNFDPLSSQNTYDDNKFNVPLPGAEDDAAAGIDCGFITLSTAEVAELFRPLVESVIELVERQRNVLLACDKTAKGVILVGGFGQSSYLFRCLKSRFAHEDPPPSYNQSTKSPSPEPEPRFIVLQPANAWTAVVRGAVLSSLQEKVVMSRKARRHYGIRFAPVFQAGKHSLKNKYWDVYVEKFRATNQINWHTKKGDNLPTEHAILLPFSQNWNLKDVVPEYISVDVIVSNAAQAPDEFEVTAETHVLCELEVNLNSVPRKRFREHVSASGIRYRSLNFSIGMTVQSGSICFDLRVDGIVQGSVKADYE
ncbi:actin-like ATPase domain-containing protein [Aureobasidium pullulans]|nr:actin-like ATPase domain-containing protein [Aureobasidium pullulans]